MRNFNVSKILPLTTFRTIDLGGKKNSDPLFSRFCRETRVFLSSEPLGFRRVPIGEQPPILMKAKHFEHPPAATRSHQETNRKRRKPRNSNVSNILPLTTLRNIDLGGKKIFGLLFSGFCGETRSFSFQPRVRASKRFLGVFSGNALKEKALRVLPGSKVQH